MMRLSSLIKLQTLSLRLAVIKKVVVASGTATDHTLVADTTLSTGHQKG